MRLLLDTHALLWSLADGGKLSVSTQALILDTRSDLAVSMVSLWEIAIKVSIGKLRIDGQWSRQINGWLRQNRVELLNIEFGHCVAVADLPHHHGDPFDRLIACTALQDDWTLVSVDPQFDAYGVRRLQ